MNYEKSGLRLNIDKEKEDLEFREVFGIEEGRADFLDKKVRMSKSIIAIENDIEKGLGYFMSEVLHPNEAAYCWLRLGQKCDCSSMDKISAFAGNGSGPSLPGIIVEILGKMGGKGPTSKD